MLLNGLAKISLTWSLDRVSRKQVSKMSTEMMVRVVASQVIFRARFSRSSSSQTNSLF
jgi:hypothetical protein